MSGTSVRIGTRGSALALWQAHHVEGLIRAQPGAPAVELVRIRTEGDARTDVPLWQVGGRAFFTKEIDRALLDGSVDIAVHSLKDLATVLEPGITLAAVLEREDPRDALLSRAGSSLHELPPQARIGTSSLRRRAFLARSRPDAELLELRGNVPTRIERLLAGDYDAIVLAAAGLKRLGLESRITQLLPVEHFPPAVSQGAIGVCTRTGDLQALRWLESLDARDTRLATTAERALLRAIEGGCQVPVGALGSVRGERLQLQAAVCALDGSQLLSATGEAAAELTAAAELGRRLAQELLAQGAARLIAQERAARVEAP
ncbi:MAG: hydroxymethylbilane synthase [Sinobacteraceae bacterium]|nr:hydroxymethylbilane synthase [Nevskiaceae bacterium]MBV9913490.1 hydroxymethylbilane synthase [Nevskiaceae bacterium]